MSLLGAYNKQLIRFFEELVDTFPEEKDIRGGLEALQGAKKVNPKLILDLFYEHVYLGAHDFLENEDEKGLLGFAKDKVTNQFNEMSSALIIFEKHWPSMSESNQVAIWKYMKVLCILCAKAKRLPTKSA